MMFHKITQSISSIHSFVSLRREVRFVLYALLIGSSVCSLTFAEITRFDFNNDGRVDERDLLQLMQHMREGDPRADLNRDGVVDGRDLLLFSTQWHRRISPPDDEIIPPDPRLVAPLLSSSGIDSFLDRNRFLYEGEQPIQQGVEEGAIDPEKAAVGRGTVYDRTGAPLAGVEVTVHNSPQTGRTYTRADGGFDIALNGGRTVSIRFEKEGYLPVHRRMRVPMQDYFVLNDVRMTPLDPQVTVIELGPGAETQLAAGSVETDADGSRQARLIFPAGVEAEAILPDGSTMPLDRISVRATEYTVGDDGPQAMPAELPAGVGYTYCVEFSVDEALAAGSDDVRFNQPVVSYLENFLEFPVGGIVPSGYFDRRQAVWVASRNGRVVQFLGADGEGLAEFDITGDGGAASALDLEALGVSVDERRMVASMYQPGQTLWRVEVDHFTPWDYNWPYGPPEDAIPPDWFPEFDKPEDDDCENPGSIVNPLNQALKTRLPLEGTEFSLYYGSEQTPGRRTSYAFDIQITPDSVPASLDGVEVEIIVGGRKESLLLPPSASLTHRYEWDGLDAYGRAVQGALPVTVRVGYRYQAVYMEPDPSENSFGRFSGQRMTGNMARNEFVIWDESRSTLGAIDSRGLGLGGWRLNEHHVYDPFERVIHYGDGSRKSAQSIGDVITTFAGKGPIPQDPEEWQEWIGQYDPFDDSIPATSAFIHSVMNIDFSPDGLLHFFEFGRIRYVDEDGLIQSIPMEEEFIDPLFTTNFAFGPDGSMYLLNPIEGKVYRRDPDGDIEHIAGRDFGFGLWFKAKYHHARQTDSDFDFDEDEFDFGDDFDFDDFFDDFLDFDDDDFEFPFPGFPEPDLDPGDGGPAVDALLLGAFSIAVSQEGDIYIGEISTGSIRRIGRDGIITTIAGGPDADSEEDGIPASQAFLDQPFDLAFGPDGSLFVLDNGLNAVFRISPDGFIRRVAGNGESDYYGDGGPATDAAFGESQGIAVDRNGALFIADSEFHVVRRVGTEGMIQTFAGRGAPGYRGDGGPARDALLNFPRGLAIGPDNALYIADTLNHVVRRVGSAMSGFTLGDLVLPSPDARERYIFDANGRHLETRYMLGGGLKYAFEYDSEGRLNAIHSAGDETTVIERNADGEILSIISPRGLRTVVETNSEGYLAAIEKPQGARHEFTYSGGGLLTRIEKPSGAVDEYRYDALGRLIGKTDPFGGESTLTREETANGYSVTYTQADGASTLYRVETLANGERSIQIENSNDALVERVIHSNGAETYTLEHGLQIRQRYNPDSRYGGLMPILERMEIETPSGLLSVIGQQRVTTVTEEGGIEQIAERFIINDATFTREYSAEERLLTQTTPEGLLQRYELDEFDQPLVLQPDHRYEPMTIAYQRPGKLSSLQFGGGLWTFDYDELGWMTTQRNPLGDEFVNEYDITGRKTALTFASGRAYRFDYDSDGAMSAITMPSGAVHRFEHREDGLAFRDIAPDGEVFESAYDANGRLAQKTLPSGRTLAYEYDLGGRQLSEAYPEAVVSLEYDDSTKRPTTATWSMADGSFEWTESFNFDGPLLTGVSWDGAIGGGVELSYTNGFQIASMAFDNGPEINFEYNPGQLLTQHGPFHLERDGFVGFPSMISDDSMEIEYEYDSYGRMVGRTHTVGGEIVYSLSLEYDLANRITAKTETAAGVEAVWTYRYNADGQLIEAARNGQTMGAYAYDANGNPAVGRYDQRDRLEEWNGLSYSFNEDGFLSQRGAESFEYSARGELLRASGAGAEVSYAYDLLGRMRARTDASGTTQFIYAEPELFHQLSASIDPTGVLTVYYYDVFGALIALQRGDERFYVGADHLGTPRIAVDSNGQTVKHLQYGAFGEPLGNSDPSFELWIGFAGGILDPDTGLVRFGWRDYDPNTRRWTAEDPIRFDGRDLNLYAYAGNDPVNFSDPDGLRRGAFQRGWDRFKRFWNRKQQVETARDAGETAVEVHDIVTDDQRSDPEQARDLLKCLLDWVPWWGADAGKEMLDSNPIFTPGPQRGAQRRQLERQGLCNAVPCY